MHAITLRRTNVSTWVRVLGTLLFAVATALSARVSVYLPFSPVPLTLQVLVVVLSGFVLGTRDAMIAQLLYLQAILVSPTAGYLLAFPIAAAASGWISHRATSLKALWRGVGGMTALLIIYALGTTWLKGYVGSWSNAVTLGVLPFVGADMLKVIVAAGALSIRDRR